MAGLTVPEAASEGAHVELRDISKSFGGVRALEAVSLRIERGSIHALVGENGAGKSTLGKIISGVLQPDSGTLLADGVPVRFGSPRAALASGIARIAQELSIAGALSVAENVFLGAEPRRAGFLRRRELRVRYAELVARAGFELDGAANAGQLRTADQQKAEILRALGRDASLIVMDEPTAALSRPDAVTLHEIIRQLARAGTTIVLVSHFLGEVLDLADEITILRDGRLVRTGPAGGETEDSLLNGMLGRTASAAYPDRPPAAADAAVLLSVSDLHAPGVRGVSMEVRAGEIVGLAGLVGAGRSELARALLGVHGGPRGALRQGIAMIPESRKEQGLLLRRPVTENVSLAALAGFSRAGMVQSRAERGAVAAMLGRLDVRTSGLAAPAGILSGGNQQKLLFARSLLQPPRVLIADEPTRGVDVGAKRSIYELLAGLAAGGMGIVLISSEIEEVLGMSDRVLVMRAGQIVAEFGRGAATEAAVLGAAFGAEERGAS